MFVPGTGIHNWIEWKCSVSVGHQGLLEFKCITITFQSDTIKKTGGWMERVSGSRWGLVKHWKGEETEQGRGKKWGAGGATVTAMQPQRSPTLPHQDLHVKVCVCVCLCMYELTLFSVSPVLAGRSCLCVALSHHLFLARLLISVLIISCSPLSAEVWRTCLLSVLFPILIFHSFSSIHPSIHSPG